MVRRLSYGAETVDYEVRFLKGRRTLTIEVHPDSSVLVRAPAGCPDDVVAQRVQRRAAWVCRQLDEFGRYRPRTPQRQYIQGETHLYLGRQYRLRLKVGPTVAVKLSRGYLEVSGPALDATGAKDILYRWYLTRARAVFAEVLERSMQLHFPGEQRPRLSVRSMRTRWGSLSPAGMMTVNVDLVKAPKPCIEYVVCHELCHLRRRNHDRAFYQLLEQVMPDWRKRKTRLEMALL